ncbi:hypothetical protein BSKO_13695 [Bryopsis sp. KO-2023]|nr:hypothetical protein BSKO_13695 [Bryopsis sp. KO-2023]
MIRSGGVALHLERQCLMSQTKKLVTRIEGFYIDKETLHLTVTKSNCLCMDQTNGPKCGLQEAAENHHVAMNRFLGSCDSVSEFQKGFSVDNLDHPMTNSGLFCWKTKQAFEVSVVLVISGDVGEERGTLW